MSRGRLVAQGTVDDLRSRVQPRLRVETTAPDAALAVLRRLDLDDVASDGMVVSAASGGRTPEDVCAALVGGGVPVRSFGAEQPSLEEAFVALTGEGFDVAG